MLGDDHVEVVKKYGQNGTDIWIWVTDKFRDSLTPQNGNLKINFVSELDQTQTELSYRFDDKTKNYIATLNEAQKKVTQAQLEVFWTRTGNIKGVVTSKTPFKISLSQIPLTR